MIKIIANPPKYVNNVLNPKQGYFIVFYVLNGDFLNKFKSSSYLNKNKTVKSIGLKIT